MTDRQQDIEKLAKLCGWHKWPRLSKDGKTTDAWFDSKGKWIAPITWNPWLSWNDAGMVWDELANRGYEPLLGWVSGKREGGYTASFHNWKLGMVYTSYGHIKPYAAIAEAALRVAMSDNVHYTTEEEIDG